jgi:hypothetical protein
LKLSAKYNHNISFYNLYYFYENKDPKIAYEYLKKYKYYSKEESNKFLNYCESNLPKNEYKEEKLNYLKKFKTSFEPSFETCKIYFKNDDFENSMIYLKYSINSMEKIFENKLIQKFIQKKLKLFDVNSEKFKILMDLENYRIDYLNYFEIVE